MAGRPSSIGFGFQPFGHHPFGSADWAEEVTWGILPAFYKEDDAKCDFTPPEPLRKLIDAYKPAFQDLIDKWERFPELWDANKVPLDQLENLGYNFDIFPSENKAERLQRAEVLNAIQFFINKGLDAGYIIAAGLSGLRVTITPFWADECGPNATLQEAGPTEFFALFSTTPADVIPADAIFSDRFARWPITLDWGSEPCRTAWLKLFFFPPEDTELQPEDLSALVEDVTANVERVRPIHVRILETRFEGPGAVGGGWTIPVAAESAATGGGWTIPVTGELRAVGGGWTIPGNGTTTP